ncbi:nucleoside hydrolase [Mycolicibacter kumamotonensis]|uniref:Nucleoside hydrolase n=1 Tax=Mycolicibacter kumamotonensis TaxID=354243 RepID=A0A1B8SK74_9MYCO|nr:nucleoside hydrolase [Mycolicibacter kumamotonensis]OBY33119.1 nucleoside hydrolase [Mycolicibacter kumamotonensis]
MTLPVFADVDTGVDDAVALVYLLADSRARLVGLAATGGNVAVQQVCRNNLALLELCGASGIPVSRGAEAPLNGPVRTAEAIHGPQGLGYAELPPGSGRLTGYDAAAAWAAAAREHPGQLVGLVTGPLTNLALALRAEPALLTLLRRLVIMGGVFSGERADRAEFNIGFDPEAAAEVFSAWAAVAPQRLPLVCGLDLTQRIAITPAILALLPAPADNPVVRLLDDALRFYFEAHVARGHGYLAYLHDPLAAAVALEPELVTTRPAAVQIELAPAAARGRTIPDWDAGQPNALIGVGVDPAAFFDRLVQRIGTLARRTPPSV